MYILSCHLSKELRKATKNHKEENKICCWNCMGYWVSSDVNDKLKGMCKQFLLRCFLSIYVKDLRKTTQDNQAENKVSIVSAKNMGWNFCLKCIICFKAQRFFLILRVKIFYPFRTSSECEEFLRTIGAFCDVPDTVKEECFADQSCLQNTQAAIHNQQLQDTLVVSELFYLLCFNKMKYNKLPLI